MTDELIMRKDLLKRKKWCDCFIQKFLPDKKYLEYQYFQCKLFKSIGFPAYQLKDVLRVEARNKATFRKKAIDHECDGLQSGGDHDASF